MKIRSGMLMLAVSAFVGLGALPAFAEPVVYATNEKGAFGGAIGFGSNAAAEQKAMGWCGGTENGCKIVMSGDGDCIAAVDARSSSGGYWYWIGYTVAENGYDRSGELKKVRDKVMAWCTASDAPAGSCVLEHSDCATYITNLH